MNTLRDGMTFQRATKTDGFCVVDSSIPVILVRGQIRLRLAGKTTTMVSAATLQKRGLGWVDEFLHLGRLLIRQTRDATAGFIWIFCNAAGQQDEIMKQG
jgi:hypothetical protein